MTGIYVRIQRDDGSFASVELDQMTDSEIKRFIDAQRELGHTDGWNWVRILATWIRDNVRAPK